MLLSQHLKFTFLRFMCRVAPHTACRENPEKAEKKVPTLTPPISLPNKITALSCMKEFLFFDITTIALSLSYFTKVNGNF